MKHDKQARETNRLDNGAFADASRPFEKSSRGTLRNRLPLNESIVGFPLEH